MKGFVFLITMVFACTLALLPSNLHADEVTAQKTALITGAIKGYVRPHVAKREK